MSKDKMDSDEVYQMFGEIKTITQGQQREQKETNKILRDQRGDNSKIIMSLIALVGATLGLKITGTPALDIIQLYILMFASLFTFLIAIYYREHLKYWFSLTAFGGFYFVGIMLGIYSKYQHWETKLCYNVRLIFYMIAFINLIYFLWYEIDTIKCKKEMLKNGDDKSEE